MDGEDGRALLTSRPPTLDSDAAGPATVLIVDDQPVGAQAVARMVEAFGHRPILAHSWTGAIQKFASEDVDLILMDAVMPAVDGFKLTKILRERSRSYVPIVFLTGKADLDARRRSVECGADDLLAKPVDPVELQMRLIAMLRIRRLTQALERKTAALSRLAKVDALTGLLNRRMFDERLAQEFGRASRYDRPLSVLMIDVDHFKRINDTYGHEAGDRVLVVLGEVLGGQARASDAAYRYGGEEFAIVAPETLARDAVVLAERMRLEFSELTEQMEDVGRQTMSVGIASTAELGEGAGAGDLVREADAALYEAKRAGRDQVAVRGAE